MFWHWHGLPGFEGCGGVIARVEHAFLSSMRGMCGQGKEWPELCLCEQLCFGVSALFARSYKV